MILVYVDIYAYKLEYRRSYTYQFKSSRIENKKFDDMLWACT